VQTSLRQISLIQAAIAHRGASEQHEGVWY
jgi:hypothetical protein